MLESISNRVPMTTKAICLASKTCTVIYGISTVSKEKDILIGTCQAKPF